MSDRPDVTEVKAVARSVGDQVLVVGNRVYDASQLIPSVVHFTRKQYLFLNAYRLGVSLEDASHKSGMEPEEAERFLERPKTVAWLEDRAKKDYIISEWRESGKWVEMGNEVLEGKKHLSKDQQVVYMAFGERFFPKPKEDASPKTVVNFNFSPEAVKEAFRRQEAIETEISQ